MGNMPVIMPTSKFSGNGVFDTDVYLSDGKTEWYLNTVSLRFYLDTDGALFWESLLSFPWREFI